MESGDRVVYRRQGRAPMTVGVIEVGADTVLVRREDGPPLRVQKSELSPLPKIGDVISADLTVTDVTGGIVYARTPNFNDLVSFYAHDVTVKPMPDEEGRPGERGQPPSWEIGHDPRFRSWSATIEGSSLIVVRCYCTGRFTARIEDETGSRTASSSYSPLDAIRKVDINERYKKWTDDLV